MGVRLRLEMVFEMGRNLHWRTVKWEEVYLKDYANVAEAIRGLRDFFRRYNEERPHSALGYRTPSEVYHEAAVGGHSNALKISHLSTLKTGRLIDLALSAA